MIYQECNIHPDKVNAEERKPEKVSSPKAEKPKDETKKTKK